VTGRLRPRSLQGQLLFAVALALLLAQSVSAVLLWRAQSDRREAALVHAAAIRLVGWRGHPQAKDQFGGPPPDRAQGRPPFDPMHSGGPPEVINAVRRARVEFTATSPIRPQETRVTGAEQELRRVLSDQLDLGEVMVVRRSLSDDPESLARIRQRAAILGSRALPLPRTLLVVAVQRKSGGWMVARVPEPRADPHLLINLIGQTLLIYAVLVGVIALVLRQITRPLAELTRRVEHFAATRDAQGQLIPHGPGDVQQLIVAHNLMEARVAALLDEKDVMLGAIGHDLKTPLSALRVRIETVEDDAERAKMAATIEDIAHSLDDILSLARVGRPSDPRENAELAALVAQVVEEFEDMGEAVELGETQRIVAAVRATWLRRALRNLVSNALRYGAAARISLTRADAWAVIRVADDGPGIPEADIARMVEPFTRGEPSRNSETGGAGLGLTLARAIAEQHGGRLELANRRDPAGTVTGLDATLYLPI
jgi:signal transduction histidine kinase